MKRTERSSEPRKRRNAVSPKGTAAVGRRPLPQRTCVACHTVHAKRELVRIVRSPAGEVTVDLRGKAPGRGAYLDPDQACLERGLREGVLAKALEIPIDTATAERLKVELDEAARVRQKETA
ncbi:MAG: YlxR family protein [Chloroflexi bacterium]|nr:MAG: YlxR family protein [Chloroflexota bacterium]